MFQFPTLIILNEYNLDECERHFARERNGSQITINRFPRLLILSKDITGICIGCDASIGGTDAIR